MGTITREMIRAYLGHGQDGCRVKIKRNSKVYRQKDKGERWEYCGPTNTIAYNYAKEHGTEEWNLEPVLFFDFKCSVIDKLRGAGFTSSSDIDNALKWILGEPHGDIYRNGELFIPGTKEKAAGC